MTSEIILALISFASLVFGGVTWSKAAKKKKVVTELAEYYQLVQELYKELREEREKHRAQEKSDHEYYVDAIAERDAIITDKNEQINRLTDG